MTYVRNLIACVSIQFLVIWTLWNEGNDKHNVNVKLHAGKESNRSRINTNLSATTKVIDEDTVETPKWNTEPFEDPGCTREDNIVFIKPYYSG